MTSSGNESALTFHWRDYVKIKFFVELKMKGG
jgi:hypothetical protein